VPFGEKVCNLVQGRDVANLNIAINDFIPDKMYVDLNVLSTGMENKIGSEGNGSSIVAP